MRQRLAVPNGSSMWIVLVIACATVAASCASSGATPRGIRGTWLAATQPYHLVEYDDEQAFWDGNAYGPVARIAANPYATKYYTTPGQVAAVPGGVLVAVVDVDAGAGVSSMPYRRLGLQTGRNCVWLARSTGQWQGLVTTAAPDSTCPQGQTPTARLDATESGVADESFDVARFTEDVTGMPLLGVKCHNKWCDLHPAGSVAAAPQKGTALHDHPGWRNKSRHDEEMLTVYDATTRTLKPAVRGAIVPHDDLGRMTFADFEDGPVHVASIWLENDPPPGSKYANKQLKKGENEIWVSLASTGIWSAELRRKGVATGVTFKNTWRPHDPNHRPLPRGRWYWRPDDQDVWVECDAGCCDISFR